MRILKYRDIILSPIRPARPSLGFGGEFKFVLRDLMGRPVYESDWKPNLITDVGLTKIYYDQYFLYFFIGDSNIPPQFSDTNLYGKLAETQSSGGVGDAHRNAAAPTYDFDTIRMRRFEAGNGTGTVREVGIGKSDSDTANTMVIRSLVEPEIEKGPDQILDVYYKLIWYPNLQDQTGVVSIDGEDYNWLQRWSTITGFKYGFNRPIFKTSNSLGLYDGTINGIESSPSGTVDWTDFPYNTYVAPQSAMGTCDLTISQGNGIGATGIRSTRIHCHQGYAPNPGIQTEYSRVSDGAPLYKNDTQTMQFQFMMSWDRY